MSMHLQPNDMLEEMQIDVAHLDIKQHADHIDQTESKH